MRHLLVLTLVFAGIACSSFQNKAQTNLEEVVYEPKDREIAEQVLDVLSDESDSPTPVLIIKVGMFFKETPYVAHTLESEKEQLTINLREMDCTTFAENCLALSNTIKSKERSFEKFVSELQKVRYRNGTIEDYPSRLHYFSDWIYDNDKKGFVSSVSKEVANIPFPKKIDFMSTHPDSYKQLKANPELVNKLAEQENEISKRSMYYIPEDKISEVKGRLMDGDIVGLTTGIEGLDMVHVGIVIRKNGKVHLMHASSAAKKVVVSEETLEEYLKNSKSANGIMIARPL